MPQAKGGTSQFTVRSNEINYRGEATMPAVVSYFQEAAWDNTKTLGISMYDLLERGLTWVLQRMRIEMFRYPKHDEKVTVETWASGREKVFLHRDFRLYSEAQELLGQATSVWLVMDVEARKMVAVPDFIMAHEIAPDHPPLPFAKGKLPALETPAYEEQMPVRWHDIDLNRHVTNTRYIAWVLEALPVAFHEEKQLQELDIIYRAESLLGDTVLSSGGKASAENTFLHKLTSQQTGKELVQAQTKWGASD
ncbi:acyl-[acyl-carrier-protein] thioesterase [Adhaeribacter soli]|uniref:Acyl-ACP thioesterase n=1 Tax=Adhaeribacter soli TaxID=2607655 RepID=A0A5N1IV97_9BACT|nr:acyl-ACP thioesterase domain-containing protein [Adhaeribacter soli]KAA9331910.1 acyl-ACP thioesterase [Adhaeribacter soli]